MGGGPFRDKSLRPNLRIDINDVEANLEVVSPPLSPTDEDLLVVDILRPIAIPLESAESPDSSPVRVSPASEKDIRSPQLGGLSRIRKLGIDDTNEANDEAELAKKKLKLEQSRHLRLFESDDWEDEENPFLSFIQDEYDMYDYEPHALTTRHHDMPNKPKWKASDPHWFNTKVFCDPSPYYRNPMNSARFYQLYCPVCGIRIKNKQYMYSHWYKSCLAHVAKQVKDPTHLNYLKEIFIVSTWPQSHLRLFLNMMLAINSLIRPVTYNFERALAKSGFVNDGTVFFREKDMPPLSHFLR